MNIKSLLATLVVSLSLVAPVLAGPLEDGMAAYDRKDYATALRLWRPLAEQGYAFVHYNLGLMYDRGQGVPKDEAKALVWYRKAAEQGQAVAQTMLGTMYFKGGAMPQDYAKAASWYRKAAKQGDAYSQFSIGKMYYHGQGVPQDYVEAHKWLNLSASLGENDAAATRDEAARKMTPAQIAEAQRLAREWKPKK